MEGRGGGRDPGGMGVARGGICSGGVARDVAGQWAGIGGWGDNERCLEEFRVETIWACEFVVADNRILC